MLNFENYGAIQKAILNWMSVNSLTSVEEDIYKEVFFLINKSATGELSKEELLTYFHTHGYKDVSRLEIDNYFSRVDTDASGAVEFDEYLPSALLFRHLIKKVRIRRCFRKIDVL